MEVYHKNGFKCQGDLIDVDYDKYDGVTVCEGGAQIYMQYKENKKDEEPKVEYNFPNILDIQEMVSEPDFLMNKMKDISSHLAGNIGINEFDISKNKMCTQCANIFGESGADMLIKNNQKCPLGK